MITITPTPKKNRRGFFGWKLGTLGILLLLLAAVGVLAPSYYILWDRTYKDQAQYFVLGWMVHSITTSLWNIYQRALDRRQAQKDDDA